MSYVYPKAVDLAGQPGVGTRQCGARARIGRKKRMFYLEIGA